MDLLSSTWKDITRKYFGDTWVQNEMGAMKTMTAQRKKLPISVEQARAQVKRLSEQSRSAVKKGRSITSK